MFLSSTFHPRHSCLQNTLPGPAPLVPALTGSPLQTVDLYIRAEVVEFSASCEFRQPCMYRACFALHLRSSCRLRGEEVPRSCEERSWCHARPWVKDGDFDIEEDTSCVEVRLRLCNGSVLVQKELPTCGISVESHRGDTSHGRLARSG